MIFLNMSQRRSKNLKIRKVALTLRVVYEFEAVWGHLMGSNRFFLKFCKKLKKCIFLDTIYFGALRKGEPGPSQRRACFQTTAGYIHDIPMIYP